MQFSNAQGWCIVAAVRVGLRSDESGSPYSAGLFGVSPARTWSS